jgi:predicted O-linked N-acetylglucosamine transferase (SPINDLY family)
VSYLGYLGTLAARYMDYLIADETIIPSGSRQYYTEKILYLPSYQANDSQRPVADRIFTRTELGLPESGFVYCCFNGNYKFNPAIFDSWMRILRRVDGSVLFLLSGDRATETNLIGQAIRRGIDPARIVFGGALPAPEYRARYRAADLFLDTRPYNAGTTASDALWVGLPVLTCPGESFSSRVAASLLNALDLPELISPSEADYEDLAVELALNRQRLASIKAKLSHNRLRKPLFDTPLLAKHLEEGFIKIHERHVAGLAPEHITVASM